MATDNEAIAVVAREKVAPRFDQVCSEARSKLQALQREVEDLEGATGTMRWEVEGGGGVFLKISGGRMTVADEAAEEPFLTVSHSPADWERFAAGAVPGAVMGGSRQGMGRNRIQRLKSTRGSVRFVITGLPDGDFATTLHFGPGPHPDQPQTTVRIPAEAAEKIQAGTLNPQAAFMQGQLRIEGDMGVAMQVGAAMSM